MGSISGAPKQHYYLKYREWCRSLSGSLRINLTELTGNYRLPPKFKYVPSWFPGANFERDQAWRKGVLAFPEAPIEKVSLFF